MTSSRWVAMAAAGLVRITQAERGKDGAMLAERVLAAAGRRQKQAADPLELGARAIRPPGGRGAWQAGRRESRGSGGRGRRTPPISFALSGGGLVAERCGRAGSSAQIVDIRRDRLDRGDLERPPHEGGLGDVGEADAGDEGALLRLDIDQALLGEAGDRLGERLPRDVRGGRRARSCRCARRVHRQADDGRTQIVVDVDRLRDPAARRSGAPQGRIGHGRRQRTDAG